MEPMRPFNPIIGDDLPTFSCRLMDLPTGFGFDGLIPDINCPMTYEIWNELIDFAAMYYKMYEVNGRTPADFLHNIQVDYDLNKIRYEIMLSNLTNIKFEIGQKRSTTESVNSDDYGTSTDKSSKDTQDSRANSTTSKSTSNGTSDATDTSQTTTDHDIITNESINNSDAKASVESTMASKSSESNDSGSQTTYSDGAISDVESKSGTVDRSGSDRTTDSRIGTETGHIGDSETTTSQTHYTTGATDILTQSNNKSGTDENVVLSLNGVNITPSTAQKSGVSENIESQADKSEAIESTTNDSKENTQDSTLGKSENGETEKAYSEKTTDDYGLTKNQNSVSNESLTKSGNAQTSETTDTTITSDVTGSASTDRESTVNDDVLTSTEATKHLSEDKTDSTTEDSITTGQIAEAVNVEHSDMSKRTRQSTRDAIIDRYPGEQSIDYVTNLIDKYPNIFKTFVKMFETDFIIYEALKW